LSRLSGKNLLYKYIYRKYKYIYRKYKYIYINIKYIYIYVLNNGISTESYYDARIHEYQMDHACR